MKSKRQKIKIGFSEEDLQDLLNGKTFNWTYDEIDVELFMGDDE
jgi:hypothetical protein